MLSAALLFEGPFSFFASTQSIIDNKGPCLIHQLLPVVSVSSQSTETWSLSVFTLSLFEPDKQTTTLDLKVNLLWLWAQCVGCLVSPVGSESSPASTSSFPLSLPASEDSHFTPNNPITRFNPQQVSHGRYSVYEKELGLKTALSLLKEFLFSSGKMI